MHGFNSNIESFISPTVAHWLDKVLHLIPVEPRRDGYSPLGVRNLEPKSVAKLGCSGQDCNKAIVEMDARALGNPRPDAFASPGAPG